MKIFTGGIVTETNTFSVIPTSLDDFVFAAGAGAHHPFAELLAIWRRQAAAIGAELVEGMMAWAQPSGLTTAAAYERLSDQLLDDVARAMPVDIVLLKLHGAMVAADCEDCEEDIVTRIRALVGPGTIIAAELDLHCNLSDALVDQADILVAYKEYPHVDINARGSELFDLAVAACRGEIRPSMALFDCRMMGLYPTSVEPLRGFVDAMQAAEGTDDILSLSFGHGFQFADIPHAGAKMLALVDGDRTRAAVVAERFGRQVYALRHDIAFGAKSRPIDEALSRAMAAASGPVVVADQSDNPGTGAPGDSTAALRWLIDAGAQDAALAVLHDPEAVKLARKAGVGSSLRVRLGGKLSPASGMPLDLEVEVRGLLYNYVMPFNQGSGGAGGYPVGDTAWLHCRGIDIILGSIRCQCFGPEVFRAFGIEPASRQLLVVKSTQHFFDAFSPLAAEIIYMAAPGAAPPDPRLTQYRRRDTSGLYPWVEDPLAA
ncbi:M81 family metallopeptidase [Sphingomonas sp.]|uniref:M81 family metallopeptidase n=1 Tax=Sphingomonas sp. TaxID=28214 RepID=UPI0025DD53EF|nr:M81 family metallopeptidase [Sphingomonas sp.]